ncbi:MAG: cadherin-like beta sandwich domain-containing protein [Moorella sp. (in: Bacteria)]|nr:cadherin-like beta sandwich domain-containing protein [Moorella sp. (in: firmicutes)]
MKGLFRYAAILVFLLGLVIFFPGAGAAVEPDSVGQEVYGNQGEAPVYTPMGTVPGGGGTKVRGYIEQDTTWVKSKSPYYMTGSVTVPEGVTLTIEPGVTVYFADEAYPCQLKVWGKLVLKGTDSERIVLRKSSDKVQAEIVLYNQGGNIIENIDCGVDLTINGDNTTVQKSTLGAINIQGNGNKILECSTVSKEIGFHNYYGFKITGNSNEVRKCKLNICEIDYYDVKYHDLVNGNNNVIQQCSLIFYGRIGYNDEYAVIKGNNNKIRQNDFSTYWYYDTYLVLTSNNNQFHHNNLNDSDLYLLTRQKGLTNVTGNWFDYYSPAEDRVKGDNQYATPVYKPVAQNKINIDEDIDMDDVPPVLRSYTADRTRVAVGEKVTLSLRLSDDSHVFGVFLVDGENAPLYTNNRFTYNEQNDTYTMDVSFDKEGVYTLPKVALVDACNNIAWVDVTTYQGGAFNQSIVVGNASLSGNANLKSLTINGLSPSGFSPDVTSYTMTVPGSAPDRLTVVAVPEDGTASVSVSGDTLVNGAATVTVTVTAQDGTKKVYTVNVSRQSTSPPAGRGDVNGDGKVTIMDAVKIARAVIGLETLTDAQKAAADFNGDGRVTIMDAQKIALYLIGK